MTVSEAIHILMAKSGETQDGLAKKIRAKSRSQISVALSRHEGMGMRVETLIKWLDALDADLVVQPHTGNLNDELLLDNY